MAIHAEKDEETNITVIYLSEERIVESVEYPGLIVDLDETGHPVSIEILSMNEQGLAAAIQGEGLKAQEKAIRKELGKLNT